MKTYPNEATAKIVAEKLSEKKGPHTVVAVNGGFQVMKEAAAQAHAAKAVETAAVAHTAAAAGQPKPAKVTKAAAAKDPLADQEVEVVLPGARVTKEYIITGNIGGNKGKDGESRPERWFEQKRLTSYEEVPGGVKIQCTRRTLLSRGLGHMITAESVVN